MRRTWILLALGASACAEPVIDLSFKLPAADRGGSFNAQCLTAVDIVTNGNELSSNSSDRIRTCVEITSAPSTVAEVTSALAGKIDVRIPDSGLASVEVMGRRGTCAAAEGDPFFDGELVFYAGAVNIGDDQLVLPIEAASSCDQAPLVVRPLDLIKLTTGTTKGDCAAAKALDGPMSGATVGTMVSSLSTGVTFYAGFANAGLTNSVATISSGMLTVGPKACLAVSSGDATFGSDSCIDRSAPTVCAMPGEVETVGINSTFAFNSTDQVKKAKFPGVVFGAVLNGNKQPIAGATVEVDSKIGEVVYVDLAGTRLAPTGGTSTGASGLFMIYMSSVGSVTISSGGLSRTTTLGASSKWNAATLVVLR